MRSRGPSTEPWGNPCDRGAGSGHGPPTAPNEMLILDGWRVMITSPPLTSDLDIISAKMEKPQIKEPLNVSWSNATQACGNSMGQQVIFS
ncbi:hypothetical protein GOODEAATRI_000360 [Goodea atripinnis]|uniref:Uncharacterized protein n=1 Tax=Goodea atripinnis TaxID=208336 RepID=A0ABV0PA57_9TELE